MPQKMNIGVTIDGTTITLELPAEVLRLFRSLSPADAGPSASLGSHHELQPSEKQLLAEKKPTGHAETVAVLALCLREAGTLEFTPDEMRRAYIRAGVRPPKVVAQALRDAKNKYELIEVGSRKGTFRLSPHGERTVLFDLPHAN